MSIRKASFTLQKVAPEAPLIERELAPAGPEWNALEWQGRVRLAADRASGLSVPRWQQHVRTGLLERVLVLGADHREGPHLERPETALRLLAHIDALAEARLSLSDLQGFAEGADLEHAGVLWVLMILWGCLGVSGKEAAFEDWVASLDPALFLTYEPILEIAEALVVQPDPELRLHARRWLEGAPEILCAIALETLSPDELSDDVLRRLARMDSPIILAAIERLFARFPQAATHPQWKRPPWVDLPVPAFAYEVARSRILQRDLEPIARLRDRDAQAIGALGPYAIDVLALAGDATDAGLACDLVRGLSTTPRLLDAMGRVGLPPLFPRLLAELESDDFDEDAHRALVTALGEKVVRPSMQAWEHVIATLPEAVEATRRRGGAPWTVPSVLEEMKRPDLSAQEVRIRADEVFAKTGKSAHLEWEAFGVSLEGALSALARLVR